MAIDLKSLNHNQLAELIERARARQGELVKEKARQGKEKTNVNGARAIEICSFETKAKY